MITVSWLSEQAELYTPLFNYLCKVFREKRDISRNFSDPDVLFVTNTARSLKTRKSFLTIWEKLKYFSLPYNTEKS